MTIIKIKLFLNKVSTTLDFGFLDRRQSIHTLRTGISIRSLSIDQLTSLTSILNIIERLLMLVLLYPMIIQSIIFGEHVLNLILELLKVIIEFLARTFQRKQFSLHFKFSGLFNGTITIHSRIIDIRNFLSKTRPIRRDDRHHTRLCIFVTGNRRTRTGRIDTGTHISSRIHSGVFHTRTSSSRIVILVLHIPEINLTLILIFGRFLSILIINTSIATREHLICHIADEVGSSTNHGSSNEWTHNIQLFTGRTTRKIPRLTFVGRAPGKCSAPR